MKNKLVIRLINYFLLIAMAAVMIGIEFYFEMQSDELNLKICDTSFQADTNVNIESIKESISPALSNLRNKIVIMFGVLTIVVAIVMTMFIKNITMPLQKMADVAKSINEGDLSQIIEIDSQDEIGMVGTAINELTSNLQEATAFTCVTATEVLKLITSLESDLNERPDLSFKEIEEMKLKLQSLIEFADSFQLLHTEINTSV